MKKTMVLALSIIIALVVLSACAPSGGSATTPPSGSGTSQPSSSGSGPVANVEMKNIQYNPSTLTVKAGTTVVWTNKDNIAHTVDSGTRDNPTSLFKSGNIEPGQTFSYTFSTPGTYPYFCEPHQGMNGTITVTQ